MNQISKNNLTDIIYGIEHPEIAKTLKELGMIGDLDINNDEKSISVTLILPMMTIPIEIRDMLINSIAEALKQNVSGYKLKISLDQMNDEQRNNFFALSKQYWKL